MPPDFFPQFSLKNVWVWLVFKNLWFPSPFQNIPSSPNHEILQFYTTWKNFILQMSWGTLRYVYDLFFKLGSVSFSCFFAHKFPFSSLYLFSSPLHLLYLLPLVLIPRFFSLPSLCIFFSCCLPTSTPISLS